MWLENFHGLHPQVLESIPGGNAASPSKTLIKSLISCNSNAFIYMATFILKFNLAASFNKLILKNEHVFLTTMMAMRPPTSPTTVMGGFSLGISTENARNNEKLVFNTVPGQDCTLEGAPALTWYFHAGVNGSGCLDSGWGVTPVYLVRLCVLSLAVDHGNAQTQPLGKRLGPASKRPKLNMAATRGYNRTPKHL